MTDPTNEGLATDFSQNTAEEKMVPQTKVNDLIGAKKKEFFQQGYNQALKELNTNMQAQGNFSQPMQQPANFAQQTPQFTQPTSVGGMQQQSPEDLEKIFSKVFDDKQKALQEQNMKAYHQQEANRIVNELETKKNDARKDIPDFDNVVNRVDWTQIPEVIPYLNTVDNAGHVMYDLANNFGKLNKLVTSVRSNSPQFITMGEVRDLSNSIRGNQAANTKKANTPPEPIDQITGSGNTSDSGQMNIDDLRNQDWLRG